MEKCELAILGPFPPPLMGVSKNNEILRNSLREKGVAVATIDTSVGQLSHHRNLRYHFARLLANLRAAVSLARCGGRIYMVPDGGLGIIYSLTHIALARFVSDEIFIHHRTFKYIDRSSTCLSLALYLSRSKATHIFLSSGMAVKFQSRYGSVRHLISGNACFVPDIPQRVSLPTSSGLVLGHLSNLCAEKGFFLTADLFEMLAKQYPRMKFKIAGPIVEENVRTRLRQLVSRFPDQVAHLGPVYGNAKQAFFDSIDVFVFPTLYSLEAQPNVIYEAMSSGNIILATERGCISEMVPNWAGLVVADPGDFVERSAIFIKTGLEGRDLAAKKAAIVKHFEEERTQARGQFAALVDALT